MGTAPLPAPEPAIAGQAEAGGWRAGEWAAAAGQWGPERDAFRAPEPGRGRRSMRIALVHRPRLPAPAAEEVGLTGCWLGRTPLPSGTLQL